jgi:acyl carrier protein
MAVADKVKSIIVEQLGVDEEEVTPDASFVDDSGSRSRTKMPRRSRA